MVAIDLPYPRRETLTEWAEHGHRKFREHEAEFEQRSINVRSWRYGAKGDGSTDDTAALLRARDAAQEAIGALGYAGATILIPPGRCRVSDSIEITASRVVVRGSGPASELFNVSAPGTKPTLVFRGTAAAPVRYCRVERLGFITPGTGEGNGHLLLDNTLDSVITGCRLFQAGGPTVGAITLKGDGTVLGGSYGTRIVDCLIHQSAGDGILLQDNSNLVKIDGCRLLGNLRNGIRFDTLGISAAGVKIDGTSFEGSGHEGLYVAPGSIVLGLSIAHGSYFESSNTLGPASAQIRVPAGVTLFSGATIHGVFFSGGGQLNTDYPLWVQSGQPSDSGADIGSNEWGANFCQGHDVSNRPRIEVGGWDVAGEAILQTADGVSALWPAARLVPLTAAAPVAMTAAPTLLSGYPGQRCTLLNTGANAITLQDQGTLAGSNLRLTGATVVLGPRDSIELVYAAHVGDWVQVGNLVGVV